MNPLAEVAFFHQTVALLARDMEHFAVQDNDIIYGVPGDQNKVTDFALRYLLAHSDWVSDEDLPLINRLRDTLGNDKIQQQFERLVGSPFATSAEIGEPMTERIIFQVAPPPANPSEMKRNLEWVKENPHYTLTADLAVIDTKRGQMPHGWTAEACLSRLERESTKSEYVELSGLFTEVTALYRHATHIPMGLVILRQKGGDQGALQTDLHSLLDQKLPVLTTRALLLTHREFQFKNVYLQKNGNIAVILPAHVTPQQIGLSSEFKKLKPGKVVKEVKSSFTNDLERVFQVFHPARRTFYCSGHGLPATPKAESRIADLTPEEYRTTMHILSQRANMDFIIIDSCFSGGENLYSIQGPQGEVTCPTVVRCSTESVSFAEISSLKKVKSILCGIHEAFYPVSPSGKSTISKVELTDEGILAHIGGSTTEGKVNLYTELHNLPVVLMPPSQTDPSRILYPSQLPEDVVDLDKPQGALTQENISLVFSQPIISQRIQNAEAKKALFLSRGGSSHHLFNDVSLPQVSLSDLATLTFNATRHVETREVPSKILGAHKCLVFSKLECQEGDLEDVVLYKGTRDAHLIYRKQGEQDFTIQHYAPQGSPFERMIGKVAFKPWGDPQKLTSEEYKETLAKDLLVSRPSAQRGEDEESFFQIIGLPPHLEAIRTGTPFDLNAVDPTQWPSALRTAVEADNIIAVKALLARGVDPHLVVFQAAQKGNIAVLQALLDHGIALDIQDPEGRTLLHWALFEDRIEAMELLLARGANPNQEDIAGASPLYYAVLSQDWTSISLLVNKPEDIAPIFHKLFQEEEFDLISTLLSKGYALPPALQSPLHDWCLHNFERGANLMIQAKIPFQPAKLSLWQDALLKHYMSDGVPLLIEYGLRLREDQKNDWLKMMRSTYRVGVWAKAFDSKIEDYIINFREISDVRLASSIAEVVATRHFEDLRANPDMLDVFFDDFFGAQEMSLSINAWINILELGGWELFKERIFAQALREDNGALLQAVLRHPSVKREDILSEEHLKTAILQGCPSIVDFCLKENVPLEPLAGMAKERLAVILKPPLSKRNKKLALSLIERGILPDVDRIHPFLGLIYAREWKILGKLEEKGMVLDPNNPELQNCLYFDLVNGLLEHALEGLVAYGVTLPPLSPLEKVKVQNTLIKLIGSEGVVGAKKLEFLGIAFDPHSNEAKRALQLALAHPLSATVKNEANPTLIALLALGVPFGLRSHAAQEALKEGLKAKNNQLIQALEQRGVRLQATSNDLKGIMTGYLGESENRILAKMQEQGIDWLPTSEEMEQLMEDALTYRNLIQLEYALAHGGDTSSYAKELNKAAEEWSQNPAFILYLLEHQIPFDTSKISKEELVVKAFTSEDKAFLGLFRALKIKEVTLTDEQLKEIGPTIDSLEKIQELTRLGVAPAEIAKQIPTIKPEWLVTEQWLFVQFLLQQKVPINTADRNIQCALTNLIVQGEEEKAGLLVSQGVLPDLEFKQVLVKQALAANQPRAAHFLQT